MPDIETDSASDKPQHCTPPRRRWLRFSLRTLLAAMILATFFVARYVEDVRRWWTHRERVIPTTFDVRSGKNVLWKTKLGTQSYGGPIVANGKVFVGTNNGAGYLPRFPSKVDLGVLLCLDAKDGSFLWQASSEKLKTGRVYDWPLMGITGTPTVEGDRLWYVTNRCELVCLDTEGFYDSEDDGDTDAQHMGGQLGEADIVWKLDMMRELDVNPHHQSSSRPCIHGDRLFVVTGNTVGMSQSKTSQSTVGASFIAVDKNTGELLWSDASPGKNVLNVQRGSPQAAVLGGVPQVIFPGGDGWLYSFDPAGTPDGEGKLLWKFDCNPKDSVWKMGRSSTRNNLLGPPTIHKGLVYMAVGQDPEHGEGAGRIWCIDPSKRGDVSPELVFNMSSPDEVIPHKRLLACDKDAGDFTRSNPNSAAVWEYTGTDFDSDGKHSFEESMHRCVGQLTAHGDLLFVSDFSGLLHCIDRSTGNAHWVYDQLAQTWAKPLVSEEHVFVSDEDGDFEALALSPNQSIAMPGNAPISTNNAKAAIYATPTIENNVLYLMTKDTIYAIADPKLK